jgi:hypothetical protein
MVKNRIEFYAVCSVGFPVMKSIYSFSRSPPKSSCSRASVVHDWLQFVASCTWQEVASFVMFLIDIWMVERAKLGNEIRNSN